MARQSNQVAINIVANDNASATLKNIQTNAKRLPESFSKAAAGMSVLESSLDRSGSAAMQAVGKLTQLGSMAAAGGPVGVGIAALTIGVGLLSKAWANHNDDINKTKETFASMLNYIGKMQEETQKLEDKIKFFGKDALEVQAIQLREQIDLQKKAIESDRAAMRSMRDMVEGRGYAVEVGEELNGQLAMERTVSAENIRMEEYVMRQTQEKLAALERLINKIKEKKQADDAAAEAARRHATATRGPKNDDKQAEKDLDDEIRRINAANKAKEAAEKEQQIRLKAMRAEQDKRQKAIEEASEKRTEEQRQIRQAKEREDHNLKVTLATSAASAINNAFEQIATGEKSAGAAMVEASTAIVRTAIMEAAALAAARQFAAVGGWIPGVGILIGGGAAAAMFAAVSAYANKATKMAHGGMVTGGVPYSDSVPILAQAGERVLSRDDTVVFNRLIAALDGMQSRGSLSGGRGSGSTNINIQTLVPYTPAETARAGKAIAKLSRGR